MSHTTPSHESGHAALPTRRKFLRQAAVGALAGGVLAAGGWAVAKRQANLWQVQREQALMGTSVSITTLADDREAAAAAIDAAFAHMRTTAAELTRFDAASPLARLNRDGRLAVVPAHLHAVLREARSISELTTGAFDATVLPELRYFETLRGITTPDARERAEMARRSRNIDYRDVVVDASGASFDKPDVALTLDGIAKGYVVDQGIAALRAAGIEYAIVDAGGDTRTLCGSDPNRHWNIGIVDPQDVSRVAAVIQVRNAALSTSGNYRVYFSTDRRLFHIVDPHAGGSPQAYSSVSVVAERSVQADGLSTGAFSMGLPQLAALMQMRSHQWLVVSRTGDRRWRSRDLPLVAGNAVIV
ncbi:MAG TPA: FAD:protein FMN transferase [Rhodanobacteraceae bacterium]|nr:FAD:protein FMN transferase [Rhodanobacteraceae bacterium]